MLPQFEHQAFADATLAGARTFRQDTEPQWRSGQRVKVVNGSLRSAA